MTLAGRRSRDRPGPDSAPRQDGLDVRWSPDFRRITTGNPELRSPLLRVARDAWDQGHRADRDTPNPLMFDPDIAGYDNDARPRANLIGVSVDKIAPYWKAIVGLLVPLIGGIIAAMQDGTPGGSDITTQEWLGIALIALTTSGVVFGVPNKDPRGVHQEESVQPKEA